MSQKNLKLISVRVDPDTLEAIDAFSESYRYWKRNTVINGILYAVMRDFDKEAIYDMVRSSMFPNAEKVTMYEIVSQKLEDGRDDNG